MRHYDYIVVGGGLAGLYTAFKAASRGRVALITKADIRESNSYFAQGGIAAVTARDDRTIFHIEDTLTAGRGLCNRRAVEVLCHDAPLRIRELEELGMTFDRTPEGERQLGLEGGHSRHRILHAGGDATGQKITDFMIRAVTQSPQIDIFPNHRILSLLINSEGCNGVYVRDFDAGRNLSFHASFVVMATGGAAAIYSRTTNPHSTLGDGIAICYEAGCAIRDMEFVQFHPTALYTGTGEAFLISEALRGEGAHLLDSSGKRFMVDVHPKAELAPRDIVARAIWQQMQVVGDPCVYLSMAHLDAEHIRRRFPTISLHAAKSGYDIADRIPVSPAAHYIVGGVQTDLNGQTTIPGLYAVGELASTGIMGANRLASNSLIECLTFGHRLVEHTQTVRKIQRQSFPNEPTRTINSEGSLTELGRIKAELSEIMMQYAGIIRTEDGLLKAKQKIADLEKTINPNSDNTLYGLRARQLLTVARLITDQAIDRRESRGGHFRSDFPETDEAYARHSVSTRPVLP